MEWDNGYTSIVQCSIIVVLTTPSVIDGFSHLPVLNYCSLPVFS